MSRPAILAAAIFALTLAAAAQTDAMPPEQNASAPMHHDKAPGPQSTSLTVTFNGKTIVLSFAEVSSMLKSDVKLWNEHTKQYEQYSGTEVSHILEKAGLIDDQKNHSLILHSYIVATGTDGYWVVYSGTEVMSAVSGPIVATSQNGKPLTTTGQFQMIGVNDKKPARWVHNLTTITVHTVAE